jgi:hypothetical protein
MADPPHDILRPAHSGLAVVKALRSCGPHHGGRTMTTSPRRSPRHLSDTALILLGRAADSENQLILPIPKTVKARGMALERVLQSLLRQGFVEEVSVGLADEAWRSCHEGRFGLRITSAGLKAIGVPALASGLESASGDDQPTAFWPAQLPSPPLRA